MNEIRNREKEIREAIDAGRRAYRALTDAEKYLDSARNWGMWDMFGGGFVSGFIKHSQMDEAQRHLEIAKSEIRNFRKELRDVEGFGYMQVNFDGLTKFVDMFCDSFFVDFLVQSRINEARKNVQQAKQSVSQTIDRLERMSSW